MEETFQHGWDMKKEAGKNPFLANIKESYRSPRLTIYGKLHTLVKGGSSGNVEGGSMMNPNRRS